MSPGVSKQQFSPFMAPSTAASAELQQSNDASATPQAPTALQERSGSDKWERALYQGAYDGLKELKPKYLSGMGSARTKAAFKAGCAVSSAVKGFSKVAMGDEPESKPQPPALPPHLAAPSLQRSSSSGSLRAMLSSSSSSGSLNGMARADSSGSLSGMVRAGSSGNLAGMVRGSSSGSLNGMVRGGSSDDLTRLPSTGLRRNPSTSRLAVGSNRPSALEVVTESQSGTSTHLLIPPFASVTLRAPEEPATYRVGVTRGGGLPFGTHLEVQADGGVEDLSMGLRQMPPTLATARQASITLHNPSFSLAVATISGPV